MTAVIVEQPKVTAQIVVEDTTTRVVVTPKTTLQLVLAGTQGPAGPVGPPGPQGSVAGTDGQIQYNDGGGAFGGAADFYYDDTTDSVGIGTSTPAEKLNVIGNVEATEFIGNLRGPVLFKAQASETLAKGDAVYISGVSGQTPTVAKADSGDSAKMPSFGLVTEATNSGNPCEIVTFGTFSGYDTQTPGWSLGDTLYVNGAGQLQNTPPTGENNLIQNIGKVQRIGTGSGRIKVGGAGRTNATPNLDVGKIFAGNASNQAVSTDTAYIDIANSRVGIGTTSPTSKLEIASTGIQNWTSFFKISNTDVLGVKFGLDTKIYSDATGINRILRFEAPNATGVSLPDGSSINSGIFVTPYLNSFWQNALIYIKNVNAGQGYDFRSLSYNNGTKSLLFLEGVTGEVGIGTNTPTAKLTVADGTNPTEMHLYGTYTDASNYERISIGSDATSAYIHVESSGTGAPKDLQFKMPSVGDPAMTLTATGSLYVGSGAPSIPGYHSSRVTGYWGSYFGSGFGVVQLNQQSELVTGAGLQATNLFYSNGVSYGFQNRNTYNTWFAGGSVNINFPTATVIGSPALYTRLRIDSDSFSATSAQTITDAATLYISDAPQNGTNVTVTNPYSLYVNNGRSYFGSNVGIGTTSPTNPLHITTNATNDILKLERTSANPARIAFKSGGGDIGFIGYDYINLDGSYPLGINADEFQAVGISGYRFAVLTGVAGSRVRRIIVNNDGRTTIGGNVLPSNTLTLANGTSATGLDIYNTYTDASNYERAALKWDSNNFTFSTEALGTGNVRNFNFTGGNVGINTPGTVSYPLQITGRTTDGIIARILHQSPTGGYGLWIESNDQNSGIFQVAFNTIGGPSANLSTNLGTNAYFQVYEGTTTKSLQLGQTFTGGVNLSVKSNLQIGIDSDNDGVGAFEIAKANNYNGRLGSDGTPLFRILNSGNVGIGTTNPTYKLVIAQDTNTTANLLQLRNSDALYSQTWDFQSDTSKDLVVTGGSGFGGVVFSPGTNGLSVRNGANAQKLQVYNTYTDASNYERAALKWDPVQNWFAIKTENSGTGSARNMAIGTSGTSLYLIPANIEINNDSGLGGRIFRGGKLVYQTNDATLQHEFRNSIANGLTGTLVKINGASIDANATLLDVYSTGTNVVTASKFVVKAQGQTSIGPINGPGANNFVDIYVAPGSSLKGLNIDGFGSTNGPVGNFYGAYIVPNAPNTATSRTGLYAFGRGGGGGPNKGVHGYTEMQSSTRLAVGVHGDASINSGAVNNSPRSTTGVAGVLATISTYNTSNGADTTALIARNESVYGDEAYGAYIDVTTGPTTLIPLSINKDNSELMRVAGDGSVGIGTSAPTAKLDVNDDTVRVRNSKTPLSATDTGNQGDICWDANYVYVCIATNTWVRSALSTW